MFSPDEADINETKVESTEIEEPALPIIKISDEDELKQMKDDLLCNLRAEFKNMLAANKIDKDINNRKGEIIEKNKIICNLTSAMTKKSITSITR